MKKRFEMSVVVLGFAVLLTLGLYGSFFAPQQGVFSENESRMLSDRPDFSVKTFLSGEYAPKLESYLKDGFPARSTVIDTIKQTLDLYNLSTFDEYMAYMSVQRDVNGENAEPTGAPGQVSPGAGTPTPAVTSAPAVSPEGSPTASPTKDPDAFEPPPKPTGDVSAMPSEMGVYMRAGGKTTALLKYSKAHIAALSRTLDAYAEALPVGGRVIFTMAPQSYRANVFLSYANREALFSDFEPFVNSITKGNVVAVPSTNLLGEAMMRGEYVYFRTDHHWTPFGSYLVYSEMVRAAGRKPTPYDAFDVVKEEKFLGYIYRDNPSAELKKKIDTLQWLQPRYDVEYRRVNSPGAFTVLPLFDDSQGSFYRYFIYLGYRNTWGYLVSDSPTAKDNCLVVCDSFGTIPTMYLTGQYKQVHYYDPDYFKKSSAGLSVRQIIETNDIQDIYVIITDRDAFDSDFLTTTALRQLE